MRSNRAYAVTVTAARANDRLRFLASSPADFVSCARGERVGPAMFAGAAPVGAWITGQSRTSGRWHRFWLGLEVRWSDPPDPALVRTTLTFAAATSP